MKIQTINTIELSSICNFKCQYCPAKDQHNYRNVGFMEEETFQKSIGWVRYFANKGTQLEVNLFGVGEPTLHPRLVEFVQLAREAIPMRIPLHLNTNGSKMTMELARDLNKAGITSIDITGHDARAAANTIRILREVGIPGQVSMDFMVNPNNWAGQVDWFEPRYNAGACPWLNRGQVMIMSDGRVTNCCIDAFAKGVFATVDDDLPERTVRSMPLCAECHHEIDFKTHFEKQRLEVYKSGLAEGSILMAG